MKKNLYLILTLFLFIGLSCTSSTNKEANSSHDDHQHGEEGHSHDSHAHESHSPWSYEGEAGPEKWAELSEEYATCSGMNQSPINIEEATKDAALSEVNLTYFETTGCNFVNNGHTVQVNFPGNLNIFTVEGTGYFLKQFHFHCPSEHTMSANHAPSEVHLVHISGTGDIAVIGILIEEGAENPFFSKILAALPSNKDDKNDIDAGLNPLNLIPEKGSYYHYSGSLTTPPCTEGVKWFVMKEKIAASAEQIAKLRDAMPAGNNRPVQPLNDRMVKMHE